MYAPGSKKGFTFFELLVAVAILAAGITSIFRVYFGTMSAFRHLENRIRAHMIADNMKWEASSLIQQKAILKEYVLRRSFGTSPSFSVESTIARAPQFGDSLYSLSILVTWNERSRTIKLQKDFYIQRSP